MWKQSYIKYFRNGLLNPILKRNKYISSLAVPQEIETEIEKDYDKFYTIEIDMQNIKKLQTILPEVACPICFGNGWITCPACKSGCRECNKTGHIDCPLCQKRK
tara:strand:- start:159 stop:470 length:312 start_codon:yes stop_codon:yes gene_type:complete